MRPQWALLLDDMIAASQVILMDVNSDSSDFSAGAAWEDGAEYFASR